MAGSSEASRLDGGRRASRCRQFRIHTECSDCRWGVRLVRFPDTTHPRHLDAKDSGAFLTHLASERSVVAVPENQAPNTRVFLYEQVPDVCLDGVGPVDNALLPFLVFIDDVE